MIKRLITHFGIPQTVVSENGLAFIRDKFSNFLVEYGIYLLFSSNYYPQGNGLAKFTNKNLT